MRLWDSYSSACHCTHVDGSVVLPTHFPELVVIKETRELFEEDIVC